MSDQAACELSRTSAGTAATRPASTKCSQLAGRNHQSVGLSHRRPCFGPERRDFRLGPPPRCYRSRRAIPPSAGRLPRPAPSRRQRRSAPFPPPWRPESSRAFSCPSSLAGPPPLPETWPENRAAAAGAPLLASGKFLAWRDTTGGWCCGRVPGRETLRRRGADGSAKNLALFARPARRSNGLTLAARLPDPERARALRGWNRAE